MAAIVEIPYARIPGRREYEERQKKLKEAWAAIKALAIDDCRLTIEGGDRDPSRTPETITIERLSRAEAALARALAEQGQVARAMCQERRGDGRSCRFPALEGRTMCAQHGAWSALAVAGGAMSLPYPEDAVALQELMARVAASVMQKMITPEQARIVSDLCRTMQKNLAACERQAREAEEEFFF